MAGIAALFAVALLAVIAPAVLFADAPSKPTGGSATSGNGTMTLRWDYLSGATGGYDFRYSDSVVGMIGAEWLDVPGADNANDTTVTLPSKVDGVEQHKLTAGTLYYFQVRGKDDRNNAGPASELFNETQRASPTKLTGVTAIAGNAEVTLSWDAPPAGDFVVSYGYRQDGGSGWGGWQNFSSVENNYTVTGLTNGTTYTFELRAKAGTAEAPIYGAAAQARPITPGAPNAPIDLIARADADEEIFIAWSERAPITGAHVPDSSTVNAKAATPTGASGKRSSAVTLLILTIP